LRREAVGENLVPFRFLQRVQRLSLEVLHERQHQKGFVVDVAHDDGDLLPTQGGHGPESPFAGNELISWLHTGRSANHERLEQSVLANRLPKLLELGRSEFPARLEGIGDDPGHRDASHLVLGDGLVHIAAEERPEAAAQPVFAPGRRHGDPPAERGAALARWVRLPVRRINSFASAR
jgi:hypothetical protein